jgi:hypothetical protein
VIKDHLILADAVDIKAETIGVETVTTEVSVEAAVVSILDRVLALFAATKNKKSITKTMICCVVMCMRMGKSDRAVNQEIVLNTNAR